MTDIVDARGLACPQPVINAKKALEGRSEVVVIVDNDTARENIIRMAGNMGCGIKVDVKSDGTYITLEKGESRKTTTHEDENACGEAPAMGMIVLAVSQDSMGRGNDELGKVLIKSFFHTLAETPPIPDRIIFFNSGVKLAVNGSDVLDDLKMLEKKGARILACGTCLNFYNIKDNLAVGSVSNMYDIKEMLFSAGRLVTL